MFIGAHLIGQVVLAPMAGVTDAPFRALCRRLGASLAVSEMLASAPRVRARGKSLRRRVERSEQSPRAVQLLGNDPEHLVAAARESEERGAEIIDINMGCPAKKVCRAYAGSALLGDEALVARILERVVSAVQVPVTLKIRTGLDPTRRNGVRIARLAESCGVAALAVHGRTRACRFEGHAEYETIARIRAAVRIPVVANGDIGSARQARTVLDRTGADAVMIGRAAQGNPWIFREIAHYLRTGTECPGPTGAEVVAVLEQHLEALYAHYGETQGVRIARKHLSWYCRDRAGARAWWETVSRVETAREQRARVRAFFATEDEVLECAA